MKSVQALSLALAVTLAAAALSCAQPVTRGAPSVPATAGAPLRAGDASRGKLLFAGKGNCLSCHRVDLQGQAN